MTLKKIFPVESEKKPYYRVRFRWWNPFDIDGYAEKIEEIYDVDFGSIISFEDKIDIFKDLRREIKIKADTLFVYLTAYRAILFQKDIANLTEKDRTLEEFVLKNYPHIRDTPFI